MQHVWSVVLLANYNNDNGDEGDGDDDDDDDDDDKAQPKQIQSKHISVFYLQSNIALILLSIGPGKPCNFSNWFKCSNNLCVPDYWRCDGKDDCGDRSDGKTAVKIIVFCLLKT